MIIALEVVLALAGAGLTAYVAYQLLLFAANAVIPDPPEFVPARYRTFMVLIPAHNEELYLPRLLTTLQAQHYPKERYRVTVVADNCVDGTVMSCRPFEVDVLERTDLVRRGKGYAIRWALERIATGGIDALVVVDGDSVAAPELLKHLNLQLERGDRVVQCYNGVANPGQSWFTRLLEVSRAISNEILHPAKRKLGLSTHLMGNGMCFDVQLLTSHGWDAFSVGEDWEYYAKLILSGESVGYCRHARVYHQESVNLRQASPQRMRWSSGRFAVLREYGPALVGPGLRAGDWRRVDAVLPLLFPNPSLAINLTLLGLMLAVLYWLQRGSFVAVIWFSALALAQGLMFAIGILHTKDRLANALSVFLAPVFLVWKMGIDILSLFGAGRKEWTRTERRLS